MSPQHALSSIRRAVLDLSRDLDSCPEHDLVDAGHALQVAGTLVRRELDRAKARLRTVTGYRGGQVVGREAVAVVSKPKTIVRAAKGVDVDELRRILGDDFGEFFRVETVLVPVEEALPRVLELPVEKREAVFRSIEQDVGAGGVGFNPRRHP